MNWLSLIFMIVCSIFTLPSTWAIDKFGIRFGVNSKEENINKYENFECFYLRRL